MTPYIGDRQLDPDDDSYHCGYCGQTADSENLLRVHVLHCPVRAATEEPAGEDG